MSLNLFELLDDIQLVDKRLVKNIGGVVVLLCLLSPPICKWVWNQAIQKEQATVTLFSKAYLDALEMPMPLQPVKPCINRGR